MGSMRILLRKTQQSPKQSLLGRRRPLAEKVSLGSGVNCLAQLGVRKARQGKRDVWSAAFCPV